METTQKSIALFGSSFNPPHKGHFQVLQSLLDLNTYDEIWLLPVYQHPFHKTLWSYEHRLALTKLLANELQSEKIKVSEIEKELGNSPSYTFDTAKALKEKHPDIRFTFVMGSDCKGDLKKWHRIEELKELIDFEFVPRSGYEDSPFDDVSSTEIRQLVESDKNFADKTTPLIYKYLVSHRSDLTKE